MLWMAGEDDVDSVVDRDNTAAALGSGVEDAFWALVCEDEEWLHAEFDAIVSEPAEVPTRNHASHARVAAAAGPIAGCPEWNDTACRSRIGDRPEEHPTRERSPPA